MAGSQEWAAAAAVGAPRRGARHAKGSRMACRGTRLPPRPASPPQPPQPSPAAARARCCSTRAPLRPSGAGGPRATRRRGGAGGVPAPPSRHTTEPPQAGSCWVSVSGLSGRMRAEGGAKRAPLLRAGARVAPGAAGRGGGGRTPRAVRRPPGPPQPRPRHLVPGRDTGDWLWATPPTQYQRAPVARGPPSRADRGSPPRAPAAPPSGRRPQGGAPPRKDGPPLPQPLRQAQPLFGENLDRQGDQPRCAGPRPHPPSPPRGAASPPLPPPAGGSARGLARKYLN